MDGWMLFFVLKSSELVIAFEVCSTYGTIERTSVNVLMILGEIPAYFPREF